MSPADKILFESTDIGSEDFTHVSEVLKETGLPVADSLKERMVSEVAELLQEDTIRYDNRRRSA